jgi:F-type H+-transporting ATPase subunit epsilon
MAEAAHITLEIVTPDGVALSEEVTDMTAPSVEGEFGVLPGHRPLLAALKTGIVSYHQEGEEHRVAVGTGFVEVSDDRAVLLTDRFVKKADVDPVRARLDLKEADEALDRFDGDPTSPEYAELVARENWAAAELELYGDAPPPTVRTFADMQMAPHESFVPEAAPLEEAFIEDREHKYEERHSKKPGDEK